MNYHSTRSSREKISAAAAVLRGIAPDGGLYMPERLDLGFDWRGLMGIPAQEMAARILGALLPDFENMKDLVDKAYRGKFETEELTPLVPVGDRYVLELFRGPTSAFKDVALSMLPQLITAARRQEHMEKEVLILTATSGDTGKAALAGFADVPGTKICVFYPDGGVSAVQKAQMVTQAGKNVRVCAVRGNFDDAQTGVKRIFAACAEKDLLAGKGVALSSANSINIGRLAPQITYYFKAYSDLLAQGKISLGDEVNFTVPTGNFGDILAGYFAKCLGLPVGRLICASNANDVLTDFIRTGVYDRRRPLHKTVSPSMDILVSSNLERLLYLMSGESCGFVAERMEELVSRGVYTVPEDMKEKIQREFWAGCCGDGDTEATIREVWEKRGYLCDTHTAVGWNVSQQYLEETGDRRPMVVLSTASPYKFPAAVLEALGGDGRGDEFRQMETLGEMTGVPIPKNLAGLRGKEARFRDVIDREDMLDYVLALGEDAAWEE